jgi:hypothetical protein
LRAFENRVLRRIFGLKREELVGGWRRLHNEELHNSYASPNIVRVLKSRSMWWVGHVARVGEMINAYYILAVERERKEDEVSGACSTHGKDDKCILYFSCRT